MKNSILSLACIAILAPCLPVVTHAAIQVYDLNEQWSNTDNPNGPWSVLDGAGGLLVNTPFPWVNTVYSGGFVLDRITKTTEASVVPGYLEVGDVSLQVDITGIAVRWTAPAGGTISIAGALWAGVPAEFSGFVTWTLTHNGNLLSDGLTASFPRSSPQEMSLLNIAVQAGDKIDLFFAPYGVIGVNLTITLTSDSVDPTAAIEVLAVTVVEMNLHHGIENSLDSKLDAALNALDDVNTNNDSAACNSLQAFINAVEAQRNKKITSAQADQLIAAAEEIQSLLNCGN